MNGSVLSSLASVAPRLPEQHALPACCRCPSPFSSRALSFLQWPNASANGYAYFHRVEKVNGGDVNSTHTTGSGVIKPFWYK